MVVAILGGGQLARMLALAGLPLGLRFRCLDPAADAVAGHVAELVIGAYDDPAALARLADGARLVTFEFENVPIAATDWLGDHIAVAPTPRALAIGQDRLLEKQLFGTLGIYAVIGAIEGHLEAPLNWPLRGVLAGVGVALLWPGDHIINVVGAVLVIGILVWTVRRGRLAAAPGEG